MIQTPGKDNHSGAEVVTQKAVALNTSTTRTSSVKRSVRMIGAGLISAALVGVFALPAYASTGGSIGTAEEAEAAFAQALTTSALPEIAVPDHLPSAEEQPLPVVTPVVAASDEEGATTSGYTSLPAGAGAPGIVNGALSQLGWAQDCTDLVQNALASIGLVESNNRGNGPDLGVQSFARFGTVYAFDIDALAPGDLLIWPGAPHAAVYVGGGQAVHGGWGNNTVLASIPNWGQYPEYVVRVG